MRKKIFHTVAVLLLSSQLHAAPSAKTFGGTGIDGTPWADGRIVVKQLVNGGPAHRAGIKVGDLITHIDGKPTEGSDFKDMVEHRLRGRAGTPVEIVVKRSGTPKLLKFTVIRRELKIVPKGQ